MENKSPLKVPLNNGSMTTRRHTALVNVANVVNGTESSKLSDTKRKRYGNYGICLNSDRVIKRKKSSSIMGHTMVNVKTKSSLSSSLSSSSSSSSPSSSFSRLNNAQNNPITTPNTTPIRKTEKIIIGKQKIDRTKSKEVDGTKSKEVDENKLKEIDHAISKFESVAGLDIGFLKKDEFALPFSLQQIETIMSKKVNMIPSFKKIKRSIYLTNKYPTANMPRNRCNCEVSCNEDCISRILFIECVPETCNLKDQNRCNNRRIEQRLWKKAIAFPTPGKGYGLFSEEKISRGDFVIEYIGELHHYMLEIQKNAIIDARNKSNDGRFINHSCDPNCQIQKWNVGGIVRIGIFAIRDIPLGTEITMDYHFKRFSNDKQGCTCGTSNCIGQLGRDSPNMKDMESADITRREKYHKFLSNLLCKLEKPTRTPSFRLLNNAQLDETALFYFGYRGSNLFLAHDPKETLLDQNLDDYIEKRKLDRLRLRENSTLAKHWEGRLNPTPVSCVGMVNYTQELEPYQCTKKPLMKSPVIRCNLLEARSRCLKELQKFTFGQSKWNNKVLSSDAVSKMTRLIFHIKRIENAHETTSDDLNEKNCFRCRGVGELICCDGCPAAFHLSCSGLYFYPKEEDPFYCSSCRSRIRNSKSRRLNG